MAPGLSRDHSLPRSQVQGGDGTPLCPALGAALTLGAVNSASIRSSSGTLLKGHWCPAWTCMRLIHTPELSQPPGSGFWCSPAIAAPLALPGPAATPLHLVSCVFCFLLRSSVPVRLGLLTGSWPHSGPIAHYRSGASRDTALHPVLSPSPLSQGLVCR